MRLVATRHAFGVSIVLHRRLRKIVVDGRQNRIRRVEVGIEEHPVRLDLESTGLSNQPRALILSLNRYLLERFAIECLPWNFRRLDSQSVS